MAAANCLDKRDLPDTKSIGITDSNFHDHISRLSRQIHTQRHWDIGVKLGLYEERIPQMVHHLVSTTQPEKI